MNTAPRLSIGLPVYNGKEYLAEALDALLGQTYTDFELIISDNASTDGTAEICRHYEKEDPRVRYFRQPRNVGLAPNHNFVVEKARGSCSSGRQTTTSMPVIWSSAALMRSTSTRTWCLPTPGRQRLTARAT